MSALLFRAKPRMFRASICLFLSFLLLAPEVRADHAIAMHGAPKYGPDFTHFDYVNPNAPRRGTLRLGVVGTFDSLHPFIVRGTIPRGPAFDLFSSASFYETLLVRSWDEPFTLYGLIAQDVKTPEDRSSVIFTLRPEAHWSDGAPITADDVLFSFETLKKKGRPNHRTYYKKVEKAEKLGPLQVRFIFARQPDGAYDREMPLIMGLMPILAKHDWEKRDFSQTLIHPPVSSGPYKIAKVEPGRSLTLARDPNYWGRNLSAFRGMYNFDEVIFDYYRDENVALQAFKAGAFDLRREADPRKWASAYDSPSLEEGKVVLERFAHGRPEASVGFILNTRRPVFKNLALRKAVAYAFDFGWINKTIFRNLYKRSESFFPNSELAAGSGAPRGLEKEILEKYKARLPRTIFTENVAPPETDGTDESRRAALLQAAEILKEAGYVLHEGKLFAPSGEEVSFEVMLADPTEEKIALEWARNLERLGISARVRTVDSAQYQARLNAFDYDVTTGRWFNSLSPGNEQIFFWGCAAAKQNGSRNYPGICDPVIDALARDIPAARTRGALVATARALDRVLLTGKYVVPFYYLGADQIAYWKERVVHPSVTPVYGPILESWWRGAAEGR